MITSRTSGMRILGAREPEPPHERPTDHEDSAQDEVREPYVAHEHDEPAEQAEREQAESRQHEERSEQAEDHGLRRLLGGHDGLIANGADHSLEGVDG